jgi:hypothetical protein
MQCFGGKTGRALDVFAALLQEPISLLNSFFIYSAILCPNFKTVA